LLIFKFRPIISLVKLYIREEFSIRLKIILTKY
jgi:hypothetical protein